MGLNLTDASTGSSAFVGGLTVDNLSWWFWVKAGIGFSVGAGVVYIAGILLWLQLLSGVPSLYILRLMHII